MNVDCDERVNVFIGPNACGKSTILRAIEYIHSPQGDHPLSFVTFPNSTWKDGWNFEQVEDSPFGWVIASDDWPHNNPQPIDGGKAHSEPIWSRVPLLYISATRVNLPLNPKLWPEYISVGDQVVERGDSTYPLSFGIDARSDPVIFDAELLRRDIDATRRRFGNQLRRQDPLDRALHIGYLCARRICPEVIHDYGLHPFIESTADGLDYDTHSNMGIGTSDYVGGAPLYLGDLSSGTQGTLLWIWALALKMATHYDWKDGWENEPAILLIDEIENHLHPTWQRRVIPALLHHFPKLQIFATTHSPFVVAGLKAGQVHLGKRNRGSLVLTFDTNPEDVVGWTADEVLRTLMGVDDPTDEDTARAARELRLLRNEGPKSNEQQEQQRQDRVLELRQQVNRDLLAGGPMAAQRELFERRFAEAFQEYRQSRSLDQENG